MRGLPQSLRDGSLREGACKEGDIHMTTCGVWWTLGIIALCVIGVAVGAARSTAQAREKPLTATRSSPSRGAEETRGKPGESAFEPSTLVFHTAENRIVRCRAATDLRNGYIVGFSGMERDEQWSRALVYAKKELACVLAEQALAGGGIRFQLRDGELRAVLLAVRPETPSTAEAVPLPQSAASGWRRQGGGGSA